LELDLLDKKKLHLYFNAAGTALLPSNGKHVFFPSLAERSHICSNPYSADSAIAESIIFHR
jgi:hypothetical protein